MLCIKECLMGKIHEERKIIPELNSEMSESMVNKETSKRVGKSKQTELNQTSGYAVVWV